MIDLKIIGPFLSYYYWHFSGPKRYDFTNGTWIYTHDRVSLHSLLSAEISAALGLEVDFTALSHGGSADEELNSWQNICQLKEYFHLIL